jgi:dTDP-4-amino-4,6-dideoxygalactose transaminase
LDYGRLLKNIEGVVVPFEPSWSKAVYHLYVIRTEDRDGMMQYLGQHGIGTGIHYPIPLHMQDAYAAMGYQPGDFPVTEAVAREIVSLPMFPQLTTEMQEKVSNEVQRFLVESGKEAEILAGANSRP